MKAFYKLLVLGIAFGIIEASVVIYLRPLFNKDVYDFSLNILTLPELNQGFLKILTVELWREFATLVLIFAAAWLVAKSFWQGFCYFVFLFGVWDIVYYLWLYVQIGWPQSIMDWDILFLIPKAWYGPVISPVIISLIGIISAMFTIHAFEKNKKFKIKAIYVLLYFIAMVLWFISFVHQSYFGQIDFPPYYAWTLFFAGLISSLVALGLMVFQFKKISV